MFLENSCSSLNFPSFSVKKDQNCTKLSRYRDLCHVKTSETESPGEVVVPVSQRRLTLVLHETKTKNENFFLKLPVAFKKESAVVCENIKFHFSQNPLSIFVSLCAL